MPLALESGVLADPLLMISVDSEGNAGGKEVLVVTTEGELVRIDATTLRVLERKRLTGD
jgi:hypothetical protein